MQRKQRLAMLAGTMSLLLLAAPAVDAQLCKVCIRDSSTNMYECQPTFGSGGFHTCVPGSLPGQSCYLGGPCDPQLTDAVSATRPDGTVIFANALSLPGLLGATPEIDLAGQSYVRNCQGIVARRFYTRSRAATLRRDSAVITI